MTDAAGKVVVHWFCAPKVAACTDDLARITTLKENSNRVYVIAYINGTKRDAQKLDPIRESEASGAARWPSARTSRRCSEAGHHGAGVLVVDVDNKSCSSRPAVAGGARCA
jgi:hypothetical protein